MINDRRKGDRRKQPCETPHSRRFEERRKESPEVSVAPVISGSKLIDKERVLEIAKECQFQNDPHLIVWNIDAPIGKIQAFIIDFAHRIWAEYGKIQKPVSWRMNVQGMWFMAENKATLLHKLMEADIPSLNIPIQPLYAQPVNQVELEKMVADLEYYKWRLKEIMPLFQDARDALTCISLATAKLRGLDLSLGDKMDAAGTRTRAEFDALPKST